MAGGVPLGQDLIEPDPNWKPITPQEQERLDAKYEAEREERFRAWSEQETSAGRDGSHDAFEAWEDHLAHLYGQDD